MQTKSQDHPDGYRVFCNVLSTPVTGRIITVWIERLQDGVDVFNRAIPDLWPTTADGLVQVFGIEYGFNFIRENLVR